jgi:hypothetical protein
MEAVQDIEVLFPRELVNALQLDARRFVEQFLLIHELANIRSCPGKQLYVQKRFFVNVMTALRLAEWEAQGHAFHLDAGLPNARDMFRLACSAVDEPFEIAAERERLVLALWVRHFAWTGRAELGAEIAITEVDEKALLEGMADFLWQQVSRPILEKNHGATN